MGPLEILQTRGMEALGRYYGTYRAIVLNNEDGINQGKILVSIPLIQTGIQVWAYPKSMGGGLGYGFKFLMPPKGEFVWVEFEYGDPTRPVWSYHPWALGEMPEQLKSPNVIGLVTPKGHYITLSEDEDVLTIQLEEGSSLRLEKDKITLKGSSGEAENQGMVNIGPLRKFIEAVAKDFMVVGSGANVAQWMTNGMIDLEDTKVVH